MKRYLVTCTVAINGDGTPYSIEVRAPSLEVAEARAVGFPCGHPHIVEPVAEEVR